MNVDEQKILERMVGQNAEKPTFRKNDQVVLMSESSTVKADKAEVSTDPQLPFQRLI